MISGHTNEKLFSMGIEILGLALIYFKSCKSPVQILGFSWCCENETIVGSKKISCCTADIVPCLLNLLYFAIW